MTEQFKNYKVKECVEELLKTMSVDQAIRKCESELDAINDFSGHFFGDCVGHASTCNKLMIEYLKQLK